MADNVSANGIPVTTRSVTYSGDAAQNMQVMALATVAGSDDAKTATDISATSPLPVAPLPASVALTGATWTSGTALNTNLDIVTEGVGTLRIALTNTVTGTGSIRVYRDSEALPFYITDQVINKGFYRFGPSDSYVLDGTTGDIYINPGGASKIQLRLIQTIGAGSLIVTPYVSAVPFIEPNGVAQLNIASQTLDFGVPALAVQKATPADVAGADGRYEFMQMKNGRLWVSSKIDTAIPAGTNNIGDVDVLTVPADPFGANADAVVAAGATGSISAKLRRATQGLEDLKTAIVLAAGTNAIGKLAANAGVNIGAIEQATGIAYTGILTFSNVFSTTQTSANLIAGTGGQRIYVSHLTIATGGTTAARVSIYYGTGAFTAGTSITLFDGEFAPSSTSKPGVVLPYNFPVGGASATGDNLRITTSAGITVYVTIHYWKV